MTGIVVKNYEHFNRALGKQITSKCHYEKEMAAAGMVSFEESERMAAAYKRRNPRKEYQLSDEARGLIASFKDSAEKNGKLRLGDKQIEAMKSIGAIKNIPSYMQLPSSYQAGKPIEGGFSK